MEHLLTWTKGIFDNSYQLFQNGVIKGNLIFDTWKNEARTLFKEGNLIINSQGFFESNNYIYNDKGELLGTITFETWKAKATVTLKNGEQFYFNFTNGWYTKWEIGDLKGKQAIYDSDTSSGRISSNTDDQMMLISGLFIREYFTRRLLALVIFLVIFIPIIS